eukprot:TRINITY_DN2049_c0_g1_i1.p1 TRINITY_DN2049_c0_g1~~TRINITY_DN2049_c0_g1_i1.p1  ORF type:complete len:107 (-),score=12.11 TRINITY_DN2049_c0_g1_i1:356-676(-)
MTMTRATLVLVWGVIAILSLSTVYAGECEGLGECFQACDPLAVEEQVCMSLLSLSLPLPLSLSLSVSLSVSLSSLSLSLPWHLCWSLTQSILSLYLLSRMTVIWLA